jgi:hypothetical protein
MIRVRRLIWDPGNVAHIARHYVTPDEVEEVCHGPFIARQAYRGRLMLIGPTQEGRMLTVVLDPEPNENGVHYPVTARPASRKDRRHYQVERGGEQR